MHTHFAALDSRLIILSQTEATDGLAYVVTLDSNSGRCPKCQHRSHKRHSAYMRVIDDLPIQGKPVQLYLKTRKWFCTNAFCEAKVFTERFEWLMPHRHRTVRLDHVLRTIAFSTNCIEAAYLTRILGMPVSHDTLLRLIHTTEMPTVHSPFCRHRRLRLEERPPRRHSNL